MTNRHDPYRPGGQEDMKRLGIELARLRERAGLTQKDLVERLRDRIGSGSGGAVGRYETGDLMPGRDTLAAILDIVGADQATRAKLERMRARGAPKLRDVQRQVTELNERVSGLETALADALAELRGLVESLRRRRPPRT